MKRIRPVVNVDLGLRITVLPESSCLEDRFYGLRPSQDTSATSCVNSPRIDWPD